MGRFSRNVGGGAKDAGAVDMDERTSTEPIDVEQGTLPPGEDSRAEIEVTPVEIAPTEVAELDVEVTDESAAGPDDFKLDL